MAGPSEHLPAGRAGRTPPRAPALSTVACGGPLGWRRSAHGQRTRRRELSLPAPARAQPRRLAAVGGGGAEPRARAGEAAAGVDRLLLLPLVSRDGARVLRGPGHGGADERGLRVREGRPRGAPGRRRALHGG